MYLCMLGVCAIFPRCMWLVRITGTFLCTQVLGLGLVSAWACMIAHNLFLFVLFLICYLRGVWNPLAD